MYGKVRRNYMKLVLTVSIILLAAGIVLFAITGFGIKYAFITSVPLDSISESELDGSCAQVSVNQLDGTFARTGFVTQEEADEEGTDVDIIERFCMVKLPDGKYMGVRVGGKHLDAVEKMSKAIEEEGLDKAKTMDFGVMRGTVGEMSDDLYTLLCSWADTYLAKDDQAGTQEFYDANLCPMILNVDYYGPYSQVKTILLSIAGAVLIALGLAFYIVSFTGVWDRNVKKEMRKTGRKQIEEEFRGANVYAKNLFIGDTHAWYFKKLTTDIFSLQDIIWIYPRSRRIEGGKLKWYVVMKTMDKREYSAFLGTTEKVQEVMDLVKERVSPLCVGFDKDKEKIYKNDINIFRSRVKNGTL